MPFHGHHEMSRYPGRETRTTERYCDIVAIQPVRKRVKYEKATNSTMSSILRLRNHVALNVNETYLELLQAQVYDELIHPPCSPSSIMEAYGNGALDNVQSLRTYIKHPGMLWGDDFFIHHLAQLLKVQVFVVDGGTVGGSRIVVAPCETERLIFLHLMATKAHYQLLSIPTGTGSDVEYKTLVKTAEIPCNIQKLMHCQEHRISRWQKQGIKIIKSKEDGDCLLHCISHIFGDTICIGDQAVGDIVMKGDELVQT